SYNFKLGSKNTSAVVRKIDHTIDVNTLEHGQADSLQLNEIAIVTLELTETILADEYHNNHETGAFILIDRLSNLTVAAGMIEQLLSTEEQQSSFSDFEVEFNALVRKHFPHWQALDITKLK
ncbi:MAG: sulfate adenylyltransferase subunit CysN, partial [Pseudomonadota bacterium]|nr:sulfate adenylyltransferase subunit CysN [Pseudomonadota bacterium]